MQRHCLDRYMTAVIFVAAFFILACSPDAATIERQPGEALVVRGQVPAVARSADGSRSIAGAVSGIASLPIVSGWPQIDNVGTVPVDAGGAFSMELAPEADADYLLMAIGDAMAKGIDALAGVIELPVGAGSEAYAVWPFDESGQTILDLGALSMEAGRFIPGTDAAALVAALGQDQAVLLAKAVRDGYLLFTKNAYLNRAGNISLDPFFSLPGKAWNSLGTWTTPEDVVTSAHAIMTMAFSKPGSPFSVADFISGSHSLVVVPPATVTTNLTTVNGDPSYEIFGPDKPFNLGPEPFTGYEDHIAFSIMGPMPEGGWRVLVDNELDGVWDLAATRPLDGQGNFMYYLPSIRLTLEEPSKRITGVELRWFAWNPGTLRYELLEDVTDSLPLVAGTWSLGLVSSDVNQGDTRIALPSRANEVLVPPQDVYYLDPPAANRLGWVGINYGLGDFGLGGGFVFQFYVPEFATFGGIEYP